jgi:hypothetical protein
VTLVPVSYPRRRVTGRWHAWPYSTRPRSSPVGCYLPVGTKRRM